MPLHNTLLFSGMNKKSYIAHYFYELLCILVLNNFQKVAENGKIFTLTIWKCKKSNQTILFILSSNSSMLDKRRAPCVTLTQAALTHSQISNHSSSLESIRTFLKVKGKVPNFWCLLYFEGLTHAIHIDV